MNEHKYIVPDFGDCGDLCFGEKMESFRKIAEKKVRRKPLLAGGH